MGRMSPTAACLLLVIGLLTVSTASAFPLPGANGETTQAIPVVGRLFPEPLMTNDFIGFYEAEASLGILNDEQPDLIEFFSIGDSYGWINVQTDEREPQPVYVVEVTNEKSPVPLEEKIQLVFTCSIHGNEKGGREGCLRVIEDFAKGIGMVADEPGLAAMLDYVVLVFAFPNTDGWTHDEPEYVTNPGVGPFYTRANANGTDLNRQWPTLGYLEQSSSHFTMAEPEIHATATLFRERYQNVWYAADIHGMLNPADMQGPPTAPSACGPTSPAACEPYATEFQQWLESDEKGHFLLGLLPSAQLTQDEFVRLTRMSELVRERTSDCPGTLGPAWCQPPSTGPWGGSFNYWGTAWETIGYEATGSTRNFMMSPYGLNAPSATYEMSYNHIVCDGVYIGCGQYMNEFHVHTVRAIVGAFLEAAATDFRVSLETHGQRTAYLYNPLVVTTTDANGSRVPSGGWADQNDRDDAWDILHNAFEAAPNDYFRDVAKYVREGEKPGVFEELTAEDIGAGALEGFDTIVVAGSAHERLDATRIEALAQWTRAGGTLVITDASLQVLIGLGLVEADQVRLMTGYVGYTEPIEASHPLAKDLIGYSRQTYDPVGVGYQQGTAPIWVVDADAVRSQGTVVGVIAGGGRLDESPNANLGEIALGDGTVRFLGALLPDPTTEFYHPYGLGSYAVTYAGNQYFINLLGFDQVFEAPPLVIEDPKARLKPVANESAGEGKQIGTEALPPAESPGPGVVLLLLAASVTVSIAARRTRP
jgi:hypothetical protein